MVMSMATRPELDRCLLKQYEEQISSHEARAIDLSHSILALDGENYDLHVAELDSSVSQVIFDISLKIRRLLSCTPPAVQKDGIKLPKFEGPTFDGNIMNWRSFWEQYNVSIHSKPQLSNHKKLAYLQQALKSDPAKYVIEGLSGTGGSYYEAIDCLHQHYDKPYLIYQVNIRVIVEASTLKEGSGKELCRLHNVLSQQLHALKAME